MTMTSKEIRKTFLDFFKSKGHEIVPSAPMVVKGDPTLMFINSGMAPFKNWFLGNETIKYKRVADTQKCLRVSGKHNDLEEVGVDTYHHTMFEMLGNWSFGDYFKKEAISWAWELLTDVYKIPKDRLYVTVFEGDKNENLEFDQEAFDIWKGLIAEDRILHGNKKDNFWEMGDQGPCGPCSEIHVDLRTDEERQKTDGKSLVNNDHPQVVEIWNNVFMQFERKADGSLIPLAAKHVDTGMGFERLCMALQGKTSNYDTDVFTPLIAEVEKLSGLRYERSDAKRDVAMRVISDHVRAVSFAICDGQLPSSNGAGYVIRRILRRAIRYGYSFLNMKEPFIHKIVNVLSHEMGDYFPEIQRENTFVTKIIKEEEIAFLNTLSKGINLLDNYISHGLINEISEAEKSQILEKKKDGSIQTIDEFSIAYSNKPIGKLLKFDDFQKWQNNIVIGNVAFILYDTFGFPIDLTQLIASEKGFSVDLVGYENERQKQKERSRLAGKLESGDWTVLMEGASVFVGYDHLECDTEILRYRKIKTQGVESYQIVLNTTPFYAESGGQVGDTGKLISANDNIEITDTKKENNLIVHFTNELPENPTATFRAVVNKELRKETTSNHTATHLLHEALREVLGTHVEQKGSLVNPNYLRFDFSHFSKMTDGEVAHVERLVNDRIRKNLPLIENRYMAIEDAKKTGAMMLFGEKYGDLVRVIQFGSSVELCGGTHVSSTGEIGLFKIQSEGAVAAGVRRIEAISSQGAFDFINEQLNTVEEIKQLLKTKDPVKSIQDLQAKNSELQKQLEKFQKEKAIEVKKSLSGLIRSKDGIQYLTTRIDLDSNSLKDIAFQLKSEMENFYAVFVGESGGKATITCAISDDLIKSKKLNASQIVRELAKEINGGGGGQPSFATAGGTDINGLQRVLDKALSYLN